MSTNTLPTFVQREGANSANVEARIQAETWKELDRSIEGKKTCRASHSPAWNGFG